MSKTALVDTVYEKAKQKLTRREANEIVDAIFMTIGKTVKKESKFTIPRFGTFVLRKRKARTGRNPRTGETIEIKSSRTVNFRPAYAWKKALSGPGGGNPMTPKTTATKAKKGGKKAASAAPAA